MRDRAHPLRLPGKHLPLPGAEVVLRAEASEAGLNREIDCAGTGDWHVSELPHPPMIGRLRRGYAMSALRGRRSRH